MSVFGVCSFCTLVGVVLVVVYYSEFACGGIWLYWFSGVRCFSELLWWCFVIWWLVMAWFSGLVVLD